MNTKKAKIDRKQNSFALGYAHPSTMVIVDDHEGFLRDMEMNVPRDTLYHSFSDPREAMESINDFGGVEKNLVHRALAYHGQEGEKVLLECNIGMLEDGIMDPSRFDLPTVLVTDYMMPGMDGLELCASITDRQVKKIMLTGQADENTGIDAFNEGLIDGFVLKSREDAAKEVLRIAKILQNQYFTDLQNPFLGGSGAITTLFDDSSTIARIMEIMEEGGYIEHYLTTEPFGYIVVTADGSLGRIIIFNEQDMQHQLRLAKTTNAPKSVIDRLESRSHSAVFYQMEPTTYQQDEYPWGDVVMPCEKVIGVQDWWICLDRNGPGPADYSPEKASFKAKMYN